MCTTTSQRKIEANRLNALKSTGPRTPEGKARSSKNATTHAIFCSETLLPDEDPHELENYRVHMLRRLEPRDGLEQELAEQILSLGWRLKRVRRAEREIYEQFMRPDSSVPEGRSSARVLAESMAGSGSALERLAKYERRFQSTMNQLIGRLVQLQRVHQHGILDDHAAKLIVFQEPEDIGERAKGKIEPNADGSDPREGIYGRWGEVNDPVAAAAAQVVQALQKPSTDLVEIHVNGEPVASAA
jgi:hypothetical protein